MLGQSFEMPSQLYRQVFVLFQRRLGYHCTRDALSRCFSSGLHWRCVSQRSMSATLTRAALAEG